MAITEPYSNVGATISTAEYSLTLNSATGAPTAQTADGVYQVFVDLSAMLAGDQFRIKIYEKTAATSTQRTIYEATRTGVQAAPFVTPSLVLIHGWDATVIKLAGTDRLIGWSIRMVA